jgi:hypothetical protein
MNNLVGYGWKAWWGLHRRRNRNVFINIWRSDQLDQDIENWNHRKIFSDPVTRQKWKIQALLKFDKTTEPSHNVGKLVGVIRPNHLGRTLVYSNETLVCNVRSSNFTKYL